MKSIHVRATVAASALGASLSPFFIAPAAVAATPPFCTNRSVIPAAALAHGVALDKCNMVGRAVRASGGVSVLVPPPGEGVTAAGLTADDDAASGSELTVTTSSDGVVTAVEGEGALVGSASNAGTDNACAYTLYDSNGRRETDNHHWRFNQSTVPARNGALNVRDAVNRAAGNITKAYNNCGLDSRVVSAQATLDGDTTARANIGNDDSCQNRDSANVVNFGTLTSHIALACTWWAVNIFGWDEIQEGDIKIDDGELWDVGPTGCSGEFDVEDVLTHEWGHEFGLGHVSESQEPYATMSPQTAICSRREITLGRGDFNGMAHIY